jgi:hypothetical protein
MDLVAKGKCFRLHIVTGLAAVVVHIVSVRPGEYPLLDTKTHNISSFTVYHTAKPPKKQEKTGSTNR